MEAQTVAKQDTPSDRTEGWLTAALQAHHKLAPAAAGFAKAVLDEHGIQYLAVTHRTKSLESARDKILRKQYSNPESQLTDLSGIRIVTYLESQVDEATALLSRIFVVDGQNSSTSPDRLGTDRIGYRSLHLVCGLNQEQCKGELAEVAGRKFEVQVRTVLQHAWAELAHDNAFKIDVALPDTLQRKLNLHSAMLELVDRGFQEIFEESQSYRQGILEQSDDDILDLEFNSITAYEYLDRLAKEHGLILSESLDKGVINEAIAFGINRVRDLSQLATHDFFTHYTSSKASSNTYRGFLRLILMHADLERYLSGRREWDSMLAGTYLVLLKRYGKDRLRRILQKHEIDVFETE